MAHHSNRNWNLPDPVQDWEQVNTALLIDIRAELQKLNRVFECVNFVRIPTVLDSIRRNTAKRRKRKAKRSS